MTTMINIPSTNTDPCYRYRMPKLQSKVEGRGNGIKTAIMNCKDVAEHLHRPPAYLPQFFGCELGALSQYKESESQGTTAIVNGAHQTPDLQNLLDKFINLFVLCPNCNYPEMDLICDAKKQDIYGKCNACKFDAYLPEATTHKMAVFVCKNPPKKTKEFASETTDKKGGKKDRQKEKAAKKKASKDEDMSDSAEDVEEEKKKKKKKDGDKKKDKKEKKEKSDKKEKKSKKKSSGDEEEESAAIHKSKLVQKLIETCQHTEPETAILEELETTELEEKVQMYVAVKAFELGESKANLENHKGLVSALKKQYPLDARIWAFETYAIEHDSVKTYATAVVKALYDMDFFKDEEFLAYYKGSKRPEIEKAIQPFLNWLEADDSSSGSSSGSDSDSD